jgi:hypothetical protein
MYAARRWTPFAALAALALAGPVRAQTVTIGTQSASNCIPFGCPGDPFNVSRYQQVFSAAAFGVSSPIDIMSLTFFNSFNPAFGQFGNATFSIFFSTTSAAVNGLSTDLASNVGTPDSPFATLVGSGGLTGPQFTINGSPYFYDPTGGNLLMDVFISSVGQNGALAFLDADASGTVTSRAYQTNGIGTVSSIGLVTEFGYASVTATPEPTTLILMATGMLGIVVWVRRRKVAAA